MQFSFSTSSLTTTKPQFSEARVSNQSQFSSPSATPPFANMATEPKPASEDVKIDLFEDDDEFEEFGINEEWEVKEEGKEVTQQWEDDWDDDDVNDDFSLQLRKELESNSGNSNSTIADKK